MSDMREKMVHHVCGFLGDGKCLLCPPGESEYGPGQQSCRADAEAVVDGILALIESEGYRKVGDDQVVVPRAILTQALNAADSASGGLSEPNEFIGRRAAPKVQP